MLNKEQRTQAEQMGRELAPLYAAASRLAEKWMKAYKENRRAYDAAKFWQYVGTSAEWQNGETMTEEQKEQARAAKKNPEEWHRGWLAKLYEEQAASDNEQAARLNYLNYLYYICEVVGEKLKPYAAEIYNQRGETFKEWAEIISPKEPKEYTARKITTYLYIDCVFDDSFCVEIHTNGGGACGAYSSINRYYKKDRAAQSEPTQPAEPKPMTGKQYAQRMAAVNAYFEKARQLMDEQHKKAKEWGLLSAVEWLRFPTTEKAR